MDRVLRINAVDHVVVIEEVLFSRFLFKTQIDTNAGRGLLNTLLTFKFFRVEVRDRLDFGFMHVKPGLCFGGCELSAFKDFVWNKDLSLEI